MLFPLTAKPATHFCRFAPPLATLRKQTFNLNGCLPYGDFSKTLLIQYLYEGSILWQIEFNFIIIGYCTNCHIFIILPAVTILIFQLRSYLHLQTRLMVFLFCSEERIGKHIGGKDTKREEQTKNIIKKQ